MDNLKWSTSRGLSLDEYLQAKHQSTTKEKAMDFSSYLACLMDIHGFHDNVSLYTKANISKQSWSDLFSGKKKPTMNTILKIVFALGLSNDECKLLLKKLDYTLASSSKRNLVIRYCLENKIYSLIDVNEALTKEGCAIIE
jgi:DNA-binding phage protein